jgi:hypothetical protein
MIHETLFKVLILGSILLVGSGSLIFRILRKYPDTAGAGFDSPDDIRSFYAFSLECVKEHKWLLTIPAALLLSYYFIQIPLFLYGLSILEANGLWLEGEPVAVSVLGLLTGLTAAGRMLFGGYEVFFLGISPLVMLLVPIILIRPSVLTGRLSLYAGGEEVRGLGFVRKTLSVLRQILFYVCVPLIFSIILRQPGIAAYLFMVAAGVYRVTVLLVLAVITGSIILFAARLAQGGAPDPRAVLRGSLGITRGLFCLYLVLAIPLNIDIVIPAMLMLPSSIYTVFGVIPPEPVLLPLQVSFFLTMYWKFLAAIITAATACAPLMLLHGNRGVGAVLRANFAFVGRNLVKYVTFIASGLFLLFLPEFLTVLLQAAVPFDSAADLVVRMLTHTISVCLAVVFLLAALKFYIAYGGVMLHSEPAGGTEQA